MLEREKQVPTVFWQLMVKHQRDAYLDVLLSASCILTAAVVVGSFAFHIAEREL